MRRSRFFVGSALSAILLGLSILLASCDWMPGLGATEPTISVSYQEATATVTATWSRPSNAPESWDIYYEYTNKRISGGNLCERADVTTLTTVTFTCNRAEQTAGLMEFDVWAVRRVNGNPYPGQHSPIRYEVAPTGVVVPGPVDSLRINVTDSLGNIIALWDEGDGQPSLRANYKEFERQAGELDTIWKYDVRKRDGSWIYEHSVGYSSTGHGLQLTALAYYNGVVVACSGDCRLFPELDVGDALFNLPGEPIRLAMGYEAL